MLETANKIYALVNLAQTHIKKHKRLYALHDLCRSFDVTRRWLCSCHSAAHVRHRHRHHGKHTKHVR